MNRAQYEACLAKKFIPAAIVATRQSTPPGGRRVTQGWSRGRNRSLLHNCWIIATADGTKKRKEVEHIVSFDTAIDFPAVCLSDDAFNADRLTKKTLTLSCLTTGPRDNGALDATYTAQILRKYDWVLRNRIAEGFSSFAKIPRSFASDLSRRLTRGGVLALVPIEERLEQMFEQYGSEPPGTHSELAKLLGVTANALARSSNFKLALREISSLQGIETATFRLLSPEPNVSDPDEGGSEEDDPMLSIVSDAAARKNLAYWLEILEFLFRLSSRELAHDRLQDPFEEMSVDAILARDGKENDRTATILPQDMLRAMTAAAKYVAMYSTYVIDALQKCRDFQAGRTTSNVPEAIGPAGGKLVYPRFDLGSTILPSNVISLDEAIRHLFASSAILIGAFAARRDIGVRSAHFGCLTDDPAGMLLMSLYIAKTVKDRVDVPVPEILRNVIGALETISADTRAASGKDWLFEVAIDPKNLKRMVSSRFHQTINQFLEFAEIAPPEGQETWDLSIHMLRRGFGIWYFYGLTGGSTDALSMMYRHNDPYMTRVYFTSILPGEINRLEKDLAARLQNSIANRTIDEQTWLDGAYERLSFLKTHLKAFNELRCEAFVEKLIGIWRGTESVIGAGGRALYNSVNAIAERAMASVRIGSRANDPDALQVPLLQRFVDYANAHFLEPVLGTNMWCAADPNNPADRAEAACLKLKSRGSAPWVKKDVPEDLMPDFDFACNRICLGCQFGVAFNDGQRAIQAEVDQRRHAVDHAATAALKDEGGQLLAELEADIARAGPVSRGGGL
ncbi:MULTISPECIES: site-specific integrase [unclassified Rhizobium]|uniref:hypothetical protein n=1 Tax=unclassified Rhizobium TaxID=2613769 RepID=UPI001AD9A232|nr:MULTISPECIES: hypothetical protein [unclassified Rhizobium]MBO9124919.1 hypothetical protein [Rhizobium sp. 16-488-2b]MBO9175504.1 hypothetical protein [Rhizobium sp. 16-488-2a]